MYQMCIAGGSTEDFCSNMFPRLPIPYAEWAQRYHGNIGNVLESFIGEVVDGDYAQRNLPGGTGRCSGGQQAGAIPAPPPVEDIGKKLEPWSGTGSSTNFTQSDTTPVLIEYLRVYECSLAERSTTLLVEIWREETVRRNLLPGGLASNPFFFIKLWEMWAQQSKDIRRELQIARPTLERALGIMGTVQMARSLVQDTNCLQRASLDIRNALGLSADAASCLPRIWNAKDPLRDPTVCSDGRDNDDDGLIDLEDDGCENLPDMEE